MNVRMAQSENAIQALRVQREWGYAKMVSNAVSIDAGQSVMAK
jgi:hypothetical protein